MVTWESKQLTAWLQLAIVITLMVLANQLASRFFYRVDFTEEQRYTLTEPTRQMLRELDDVVYVDVYLAGEMPANFLRLQRTVRETLEEFRAYAGTKVQYQFIDPWQASNADAQRQFLEGLQAKGIFPIPVNTSEQGEKAEKALFPGAVISYGAQEETVILLQTSKDAGSIEAMLNASLEGMEYNLASAIAKLTTIDRKTIGILRGHGELSGPEITGVVEPLQEFYQLLPITLEGPESLSGLDALIVAKPDTAFSRYEKYLLDQYLMAGGKMLWCLDLMEVNMDSAGGEGTVSIPYELNLEDQLFKYGLRINYDLVLDNNSGTYPVVVSELGGQPQMSTIQWPFFVLINNYADHPITHNLDAIYARFVSTMDTVKAPGVRKTRLLASSPRSLVMGTPVSVNINDYRTTIDPNRFNGGSQSLGYLLEGEFTSLFSNQILPARANSSTFVEQSSPDAKLVVISDGDLLRSTVNPRTGQPLPLGFDPFEQVVYANQDFLLNTMAYLLDADGLINARTKEIVIRPLDQAKISEERTYWQVINLVVPIVALALFGLAKVSYRRWKYGKAQRN